MSDTEEIRKKIAALINERGLNYAQVSLQLGRNIAYIQQFIKNGSPRRLGEVERQKLAKILNVDEQELTDLPLHTSTASSSVNADILCLIIENIENWLVSKNRTLSPRDKADLIKLIYLKICDESKDKDSAVSKVKDFIEIYDVLKKAN
jgi:transposase-like protein